MRHVIRIAAAVGFSGAILNSGFAQQYPLLDELAGRVVQKYQTSSCQQLAAQRGHRPTGPMEERAIRVLHEDPGMRQEFINRVAAPIANKLFECGLIP